MTRCTQYIPVGKLDVDTQSNCQEAGNGGGWIHHKLEGVINANIDHWQTYKLGDGMPALLHPYEPVLLHLFEILSLRLRYEVDELRHDDVGSCERVGDQ